MPKTTLREVIVYTKPDEEAVFNVGPDERVKLFNVGPYGPELRWHAYIEKVEPDRPVRRTK